MSGGQARLFVAAEIPASVRGAFAGMREDLVRLLPAARWVRAEGLHLTLKFLGATPRERLEELGEALAAAVAGIEPLRLVTASAGLFGPPRRPRVLWLALGGDLAGASTLASVVEAALAPLGFPAEERPFRAHLTLARFADRATPVTEDVLRAVEAGLGSKPVPVDAVVLFESVLGRGGARYDARRTCPLAGARS